MYMQAVDMDPAWGGWGEEMSCGWGWGLEDWVYLFNLKL